MSKENLEKQFNEKELSQLLSISIGTLRYWRIHHTGPRYRKCGHLVRYAQSDVQAWLNSRPMGGEVAGLSR
jgi:predicted DNA-binding transcriptional regulator AlpA